MYMHLVPYIYRKDDLIRISASSFDALHPPATLVPTQTVANHIAQRSDESQSQEGIDNIHFPEE